MSETGGVGGVQCLLVSPEIVMTPAWLKHPLTGRGGARHLTDQTLSGTQGTAVREPCLNHAWVAGLAVLCNCD